VSEYLQGIRFHNGDWIETGAPLFDLRPFAAVRDRAAANLRLARARQALAHSEYERDTHLRASEAVSDEDVQQRESDQSGADATVSAAENNSIWLGRDRRPAPTRPLPRVVQWMRPQFVVGQLAFL
jgi:hypothetical protein